MKIIKFVKNKDNKGVTLIALIVTVVILILISSVVAININTGQEYRNYQKMCSDIRALEDELAIYYNKDSTMLNIIILGDYLNPVNPITILPEEIDDEGDYYPIDVSKITSITLNYGKGDTEDKDIYIVNRDTLKVYYLKGVKYDGVRYYGPYEQNQGAIK